MDITQAVTPGGSSRSREEKIVFTVRLRPLNKKENLAKDQVAWKGVDDHTIVSKIQAQERLHHQSSFTFDKVFGPESLTENVYEDGVKNVALSALMGINATIFAYGQTSSGKTYTIRGESEKAVNGIYNHIIKAMIKVANQCLDVNAVLLTNIELFNPFKIDSIKIVVFFYKAKLVAKKAW